jgi:primosomal protein N' (replication factor Y)
MDNCPACKSTAIAMYGSGTQYLESEIKKILPKNYKIIRSDSDQKKLTHLHELDEHQNYCIIGTQQAWSNLRWPKTNLMVFVDIDTLFFIPEYKLPEQTWYWLRDAQYKLPKTAELVIQTEKPQHALFQGLFEPTTFYEIELNYRKKFGYPPYTFLVKLFTGNSNQQLLKKESAALYNTLLELTKQPDTITITSPLPMFPFYHKKRYWNVLIIKIERKGYSTYLSKILTILPPSWNIDINPTTLLTFSVK